MEFTVSEACCGCGACVRDCPVAVLTLQDGRAQVRADRAGMCLGCQHCLAVCPTGAVAFNGTHAADVLAPVPPRTPVDALVKTRRSIRQFAADDLSRAEIADVLETLKYVPTGCNVRHLTFTVVTGRARLAELRARTVALLRTHGGQLPDFLKSTLVSAIKHPESDPFFRHAPHLLIVSGDPGAVTPQYDCVAACAYFDLLAQSRGLGVCWCGFFKIILDAVPEAASIFGLAPGVPCYAMLFGRPAVAYARGVNRAAGASVAWL